MKNITKISGMVAIVAMFAFAAVSGNIGEADAAKASGNDGTQSPKSYGSATAKIVCGDQLCDVSENQDNPNKR